LTEALHDPQAHVCAAAAAGLGRIGLAAHPAVPELAALLHGPRLTPAQREHIGRLIAELDSDDYPVRAKAQRGLEALGRLPLAPLRDALAGQPSLEARRRMEEVLGKALLPDAEVRRQVVVALGAIGPEARSAAPALVAALHDEEPSVAESAAEALAKAGVMEPVVEALRARDARLRASATRALLSGPKDKGLVPALVKALKDESVQVRYWAAFALGEFGHDGEAAVPALTEALKEVGEPPYRVGERARLSLNKLGHPAEEVDGLKTSLAVDGWQDEGKLRVTLTYRWAHRRGRWVFGQPLHSVTVSFWDAEGHPVQPGAQEQVLTFERAFVRMEQDEMAFSLVVVVPPQAVSISIPFGVAGLETRRVSIPIPGKAAGLQRPGLRTSKGMAGSVPRAGCDGLPPPGLPFVSG
jgi:HEAT repeat protein